MGIGFDLVEGTGEDLLFVMFAGGVDALDVVGDGFDDGFV